MIHRYSRFIPALIVGMAVIASLQLSSSALAHAETNPAQAITLSPASTEVKVDPGTSAAKSLDIINSGANPFNITLTTAPYYVTGENYDPHFTQLPGTVDASAWVHLSLTASAVGGYKVLTVPYTVEVPQGTPAGGYYAVVFAETSTDDQKTGVVSHNRVGDILYITVNGNIKSSGNITGDALPAVSFVGSIPIGAKISNNGGAHFITTASYTVTDWRGNKVYVATTDRYVLPQTEREITALWSPQSLLGLFTVHRSATIAGVMKSLPDEHILIINPWILIGLTFLIGILIGIPLRRARQRRSTKEQ